MSISKKLLKSKPVCKVTFRIPKDNAHEFAKASVLGDFNDWNASANPMKKIKKDGSFSLTVDLETGKDYQFKYLLDGNYWMNENDADRQATTHYGDSQNSILSL